MRPGWLADLVWRLSGGKIDRETERYILHELPYGRALCYMLAYWSSQPYVWTVEMRTPASAGSARKRVSSLIERMREEDPE